jgi:hypothetical protein
MAGMHHALSLGSRILAGIVAAIAFYFAFCLYENEEGIWQNRMEGLWAGVDDRAKTIDSSSVALFNKVGEITSAAFTRLFGRKLFSYRSLLTSLNLSLASGLIGMALIGTINVVFLHIPPYFTATDLEGSATVGVLFCGLALAPHYIPKWWTFAISSLPFLGLLVVAGLALFAPTKLHNPPNLSDCSVLALSLASDFFAVAVMRRLFSTNSDAVSTWKIASTLFALFALSFVLLFLLPFVLYKLRFGPPGSDPDVGLAYANFATALMCFTPGAMLTGLLVHRLIWPLLSRLLYPVASRKVITNRKALVSIASACVFYAANIPQDGIKGLLKLFSGS